MISNPEELLSAWIGHFRSLSKSKLSEEPGLQLLSEQVDAQVAKSDMNERNDSRHPIL